MINQLGRAVLAYPRRAPMTFSYVVLLLAGYVWVRQGLSAERANAVLGYVSTNLDNLQDHPVTAMLGSVLFFDGTLTDFASLDFVGTVIILGLGVICCLAWAERRWGAWRAAALFLAGHIIATLLTTVAIVVALGQGWYPEDVRHSLDYGVSYGSQTMLALAVLALPRWARIPWAVFALGWPLGGLVWFGPMPDFNTIGHVLGAVIGLVLAAVPALRRPRVDTPR
ncbi:rhomboid-like protein [Actinoplanes sp. NPDC051859]|uniref:rhomboid-like protein n=1 Tax=Actinoplanes sp. NPDC051859 TaxID=3363909 RepID=UPI00378E8B0B